MLGVANRRAPPPVGVGPLVIVLPEGSAEFFVWMRPAMIYAATSLVVIAGINAIKKYI